MRVVIVDDEPLARETVRMLLANDSEIEIAGECSGVDAPALIEETKPDILFLDVQMPEVDGFDVLEQIGRDAVPAIVFVTAYDRYALRAFEVHAIDYLLKPFDDRRFAEALARAKALCRSRSDLGARIERLLAARERPAPARRFLVRVREKVVVVPAGDIDWIEAADYYVSLHVAGKSYLLRQTMAEIAEQLDPEHFLRIHRSTIVNLDRVRELHPLFRGESIVVLRDGTELRASRGRREELERMLAGR